MRLSAPRLARVRSFFSPDGQFAEFLLLNKAGRNLSFTVAFAEIGKLMTAFQAAAREMGRRLAAKGHAIDAQVAEGLASAAPVTAIAMGKDADSGEALLWLETADGPTSVRLGEEMFGSLEEALAIHRRERDQRAAAE